MKVSLVLVIALLSTTLVFGQKKGKVDPKDLKIDSLTTANTQLSAHLDSVSTELNTTSNVLDSTSLELTKYFDLYTTIKEKVVKRDFDPATMGHIIDSLRASRDSTALGFSAANKALSDSVLILQMENKKLQASVDSLSISGPDRTALINELKQLKELLDAGIITQEDFDKSKNKIMERW